MAEPGPEPTGWELMRGITEIKLAIRENAEKSVQRAVYEADQRGTDDRFRRVEARAASIEANLQEGEKLKRQQRLTIALAIFSPIAAILSRYIPGGGA